MNKKNLLIAGGTGFIGYHVARKAIKKNWNVFSISTNLPKKKRKLNKVKYFILDIFNKSKLDKINNIEFDYVVNLSGYVDHSNKSKTYRSHFLGCKNLTKILLRRPPISFVQMGSSLEYGKTKSKQNEYLKCKPISIYAKSKFYSTRHLLQLYKKYNFPATILRLYQGYGEKQDENRLIPFVIKNCLENKKFKCSEGSQIRDFIYIDDIVNAIFKVFNNKNARGKIFNLGSGKGIKIQNLIKFINKTIKKGTPLFGKIKLRSDESLEVKPSLKRIKKILKWKPQFSLERGLKRTIKSYE